MKVPGFNVGTYHVGLIAWSNESRLGVRTSKFEAYLSSLPLLHSAIPRPQYGHMVAGILNGGDDSQITGPRASGGTSALTRRS